MYIIKVLVGNKSLNVNRLYSYYYESDIEAYKRVNVIFNHQKLMALTVDSEYTDSLQTYEKKCGYKLSPIMEVIDNEPIINKLQFEEARWLSKTTVSPFISCLNTMLPKALRTLKNEIKPVYEQLIIKHDNPDYKFTAKQKEIYDSCYDGMKLSDARKLSVSIVKKLTDNKLFEIIEKPREYKSQLSINSESFKKLTEDQKEVYEGLINSDKPMNLLFGVTGAGKTEVYLHLARKYLEEGKQVLILVPEISLTPQMIERVSSRFKDVIFYHSALSDQQRFEQYLRVIKKEVRIVVGTRSAIFLPFDSLGLIIIDEEHDSSYTQDSTPCYSVKNVAARLAYLYGCKVLLASATPSLDSYTRALKGEYRLLTLNRRINNTPPDITIVDLVNECRNRGSYIISKPLKQAIGETLNNKQQAIILLNRRGYSSVVKCLDCGNAIMCENCDRSLTYHADKKILKCHECGREYRLFKRCPNCGSINLSYYGYGTQKVEQELQKLFPDASIGRMDADTTVRKGAHEAILKSFENHEYDILIGTQMIAKGLDYPSVTLVGILNADAGLMHQDFNAASQTFNLLMQASGRSGRASKAGRVFIQAFNSDHYVLKAVLKQDYNYYYNIEMNYRHKLNYPPYSHLMELIVSDMNEERLHKSLSYLMEMISPLNIKIYKPVELNKIKDTYRYRIMLMDKNGRALLDTVWGIIDEYLKGPYSKIKIQMDPLYLE